MSFPATRLRRFRKTPILRRLVRETAPVKGVAKAVGSMPGVYQQSVDRLVETAAAAFTELGRTR